jgi:demethylmenaquinone methyltransferase/2-methoxy-6-polyprenyl-1,4-benzoquinol methylase
MNIHFDFLATIYDRTIGVPDTDVLAELLDLPTEGKVLDAGGGTGRVSSQLRDKAGEIVICDLSHNMLKEARFKKGMETVRSHTERLPFPDATFDRILVVDAFHHFCDQERSLSELLRVLAPGGRLVIEEPDIRRFVVKLVALAEKLTLMRSHFYSGERIRRMIDAHGYEARVQSDGGFAVRVVVEK